MRMASSTSSESTPKSRKSWSRNRSRCFSGILSRTVSSPITGHNAHVIGIETRVEFDGLANGHHALAGAALDAARQIQYLEQLRPATNGQFDHQLFFAGEALVDGPLGKPGHPGNAPNRYGMIPFFEKDGTGQFKKTLVALQDFPLFAR